MKKMLFCAVALFGIGAAPVMAADLPVAPAYTKAPAVVAPPIYNWTGFYVGGNVGYGWGKSGDYFNFNPPRDPAGSVPGATLLLQNSQSSSTNGLIGGVQAGYNWQFNSNFLVGIETDFQGSAQKGTLNSSNSALYNDPFNGNVLLPASLAMTTKLDWFGTVRARVGVTNDHWLLYGTAGLAYGEVETSGAFNIFSFQTVCCAVTSPIPFSNSNVNVGWVVGAGVENAITDHWSWKLEYLYMDLGSVAASVVSPRACFGAPGFGCGVNLPATASSSVKFTDNILRFGINYKFGGPVVARY
jgi:outer membrane immunogenic protein